jgi:hypothetical protein
MPVRRAGILPALLFSRRAAGKQPMNKPRLNFGQIWNMSFGFLGIQFGWG